MSTPSCLLQSIIFQIGWAESQNCEGYRAYLTVNVKSRTDCAGNSQPSRIADAGMLRSSLLVNIALINSLVLPQSHAREGLRQPKERQQSPQICHALTPLISIKDSVCILSGRSSNMGWRYGSEVLVALGEDWSQDPSTHLVTHNHL